MNFIFGVIAFVILLPIIVFVHEFGHFLFARLNGVRVESFSIGFGKSFYSWTDKRGTVWKLCIIPLGGYVKMLGQSDTPETAEEKKNAESKLSATEKKQSFEFKKRYQKASIVLAGPLFNFIFGFIVFFMLFIFRGVPLTPSVVMDVQKDSGAYVAGIKSGDTILSINDVEIKRPQQIAKIVQTFDGKVFDIKLKRDDKTLTVHATPTRQGEKYILGVSYSSEFNSYEPVGVLRAISLSYETISGIVRDTIKSLWEIIAGTRSSNELGGMISIAKVGGNALSSGFYSFMYLIALISVSLGLFNIFPIPVLDGGYLFIYLIEAIIRRDIPEKVKEKMFFVGFMFIIFLLLLSNVNDIIRIIK